MRNIQEEDGGPVRIRLQYWKEKDTYFYHLLREILYYLILISSAITFLNLFYACYNLLHF